MKTYFSSKKMSQNCNILVFFILSFILSLTQAKLPSYINVCSRNDPKLDECIINSVMSLQPLLRSGKLVEDYQVPSIEPFTYNDFVIDHGSTLKVEIKDLKSWNGSNFSIDKLRTNLDKMTFDFVATMPSIKVTGKYKMNAKLPIIDISGKGDMINFVSNSKIRIKLYGSKYDKDGSTYIKFDKANVRFVPGESKITLTNLFNGDPTLGQLGNQVVNENQDLFIGEIIPVLEKQFSEIFLEVGNKIIGSSPFDEIMPE